MALLKWWCLCILLIGTTAVYGQRGLAIFENLTTGDGLPQNSVTSIIQDQHGFMWMGTQDGLCRFDGSEFKIYRSEKGDTTSISHNFVWDITEDQRGIFWIATFGNGLNRFDPTTGTFTQYLHDPDKDEGLSNHNIFATQWAGGYLWVGTNNGLDRLDERTGKCVRFFQHDATFSEGKTINLIRTFAFDPPHSLWMNTDQGLTLLNVTNEEVNHFIKSPFGLQANLLEVRKLKQEGEWLYVLTKHQLLRIDFSRQREELLLDATDLNSESPPVFTDFILSNGLPEWIATESGLYRQHQTTGRIGYFEHSSEDNRSLSHNFIISMCRSEDGVLWAGTRNGLSKMNRTDPDFELYRNRGNVAYALSDNSVQSILEDRQKRLWVGTHDGVDILDRETGVVHNLRHQAQNPATLTSNYVLSMATDRHNTIWIGTNQGGFHRISEPYSTERITVQRLNFGRSPVHYILPDDSLVWVGTGGDGLYKCDENGKVLRHYPAKPDGDGPAHSYIYHICKDNHDNYWLATPTGGLQLFDPKQERFRYIQSRLSQSGSLSGNTVLCIFQDSRHRLWIGTTSGLSRLDTPLERNMFAKATTNNFFRFSHFGRGNGFPNEVIYGIVEDNNQHLWITTNNGLVHFDPDEEHVLRTYYREDGCQGNEYNQNAYGRNDKGELFFGGVEGFHVFHPDSLRSQSYLPPVMITDVQLNYESVPYVSEGDFALGSAPHLVNHIELDYHQDVISFAFAALSYANSTRNRYAWKLEGFDADWNYAGQNQLVTYTNPDPGEYTFRVKASNSDGLWNEQGAAIAITVLNPPWKSWYAYLFYAALLLSIFYAVIKVRTQKAIRQVHLNAAIARAREEERAMFRKKSAQDFHDEAGNKITRINLLVELARGESGEVPHVQEYLEKIGKNTAELSSGMRDFNWAIDPDKDLLRELVLRIQSFGETMFEGGGVAFTVEGAEGLKDSLSLSMQLRRDLLLIFKEAINNTVRHANASEVLFSVEVQDITVKMCLGDNGSGFSETSGDNEGYGLRNMRDRAARNGIKMSITSQPGSGTKICTNFKIPQMGDATQSTKH